MLMQKSEVEIARKRQNVSIETQTTTARCNNMTTKTVRCVGVGYLGRYSRFFVVVFIFPSMAEEQRVCGRVNLPGFSVWRLIFYQSSENLWMSDALPLMNHAGKRWSDIVSIFFLSVSEVWRYLRNLKMPLQIPEVHQVPQSQVNILHMFCFAYSLLWIILFIRVWSYTHLSGFRKS